MSSTVGSGGGNFTVASTTRVWRRVFFVVLACSVGVVTLAGAAFFIAVDAEGGY
mgnify:CR=1 FL=1